MMPADAYRCYLALKNHFTKDHYDYIKYRGKTRASNQAFYKRKDRFWFEKFARNKNDKEIEEFFVSNFTISKISCLQEDSPPLILFTLLGVLSNSTLKFEPISLLSLKRPI